MRFILLILLLCSPVFGVPTYQTVVKDSTNNVLQGTIVLDATSAYIGTNSLQTVLDRLQAVEEVAANPTVITNTVVETNIVFQAPEPSYRWPASSVYSLTSSRDFVTVGESGLKLSWMFTSPVRSVSVSVGGTTCYSATNDNTIGDCTLTNSVFGEYVGSATITLRAMDYHNILISTSIVVSVEKLIYAGMSASDSVPLNLLSFVSESSVNAYRTSATPLSFINGGSQYFWYVIPKTFSWPTTFVINGAAISGNAFVHTVINVTSPSGYVDSYRFMRSPFALTGNVSVQVQE